MNILINCSNLKKGGGLQVADSICGELSRHSEHIFVIVLSSYMEETRKRLSQKNDLIIYTFNIKNNFSTLVRGRNRFLDNLVEKHKIDAVLTIFGPSRWNPRCTHLCGFARAHLVLPDSPYYLRMNKRRLIKERFYNLILKELFIRGGSHFWTENQLISDRLKKILPQECSVYTVSNYYNQVFDNPQLYKEVEVVKKDQCFTCLSISSYKDYKNFEIIPLVLEELQKHHPDFNIRFVLTLDQKDLEIPAKFKDKVVFVGKVDIANCPYLYEISDLMFMPTLLECFTASYPEAMRMRTPIVTTDLEFARGLCGEAACYYHALDVKDAADAIYKVAMDKDYAGLLVANGVEQLRKFYNYEQRVDKLIGILEIIAVKE